VIRKSLNFLAFQANWFACVLGAAKGLPWLGPLATALLGLEYLRVSRRRGRALALIATALGLGLLVDSLLTVTGRLLFPEITAGPWPPLAPPWILALWVALATTLDSSMSWLRGRYWLAAGVGAVSGPFAYLAGERLGAVDLGAPLAVTIGLLAFAWAVSLPLLFLIESALGVEAPPEA
jgi:hypothetical protein